MPPGPLRDALAGLHAAASAHAWQRLHDSVWHLVARPGIANEPPLARVLAALLNSSELQRLQRLDALSSDEIVRRYRSLLDRQGPRPGSAQALAQGVNSKRRGAAMEKLTADALATLAQRLDEADHATGRYRVATSMRVPARLCNGTGRAKSEWDAVLLERADDLGDATLWHVRLLAEAKASADAATTDLPRLLRGLRVLASADEHAIYPFETSDATVRVSGASLHALQPDDANLQKTVLYCSDAPVEPVPRVLGAATRMQLLSSPHALEFASALADGRQPDTHALEALWQQLLDDPKWRAVLDQYPTLRQARELVVHPDDLRAAVSATRDGPGRLP